MSTQRSNRKKKNGNKGMKAILLIVALLVVLLLAGSLFLGNGSKPPQPGSSAEVTVTIPLGSSSESIGQILADAGVVKSALVFRIQSKLKGLDGHYRAGDYVLSPGMSMEEIMDLIQVGGTTSGIRFTIPEGYTVEQTISAILGYGAGTSLGLQEEAQKGDFDYWFLKDVPDDTEYALEGYLYPETYDVYKDATDREILDKMLSHFDTMFTREMAAQGEEMGFTINEILTIASLIERETRVDDERSLVSSVIFNRLAKDMPLQIDATVQYALGTPKEALSIQDTKIDSPYNTYQIQGLPPGPICSPSIRSIEAALNPAYTDYIYYVLGTDGTGAHKFSETYEEFLVNKNAYKEYRKLK